MAKKTTFLVVLLTVSAYSTFAQFRVEVPITFVEENITNAEFVEIFNYAIAAEPSVHRVNRLPEVMFDEIFRGLNAYAVSVGDMFMGLFAWGIFEYAVFVRVTSVANGRASNIEWMAAREEILWW